MVLRVGISGLGRWGQVLVDSIYEKSEMLAVVAGCTGSKEKVTAYCTDKGIDLRNTFADLLKDDSLDAVIIATPHSQHTDQIIAAANAGKHVFVEKPFTLTKESAERARNACDAAGVVCALGHNRRFLPNMTRLRNLVDDGEIGDPVHVEANISSPGRDYSLNHWRSDPKQCPAGSMTGLGVHMTDALISIMGPVAKVNAVSEMRSFRNLKSAVTFMTLHFASGATGVFSTLFQTAPVWFLRVSGNQGWAEVRDFHRLTSLKIGDAKEHQEKFAQTDIEQAELEAFAEAIAGKAPYPISAHDAVHGTAVFEAVVRSVETGAPVDL